MNQRHIAFFPTITKHEGCAFGVHVVPLRRKNFNISRHLLSASNTQCRDVIQISVLLMLHLRGYSKTAIIPFHGRSATCTALTLILYYCIYQYHCTCVSSIRCNIAALLHFDGSPTHCGCSERACSVAVAPTNQSEPKWKAYDDVTSQG